jgi:hypothetical protein
MFAKLEKFGAPDRNRWHSSAAAAAPSNDNHSVRRFVAASRRRRRPILYCHWHKGPTGGLECVWDTKAPDAAAADEPGMCWLVKQRQLFRDTRSLAEPRRAAAA